MPLSPLTCTSPDFTEEELQKFDTRLEEGFDIPDEHYSAWLHIPHSFSGCAYRKEARERDIADALQLHDNQTHRTAR